jgi:hypothetical protein
LLPSSLLGLLPRHAYDFSPDLYHFTCSRDGSFQGWTDLFFPGSHWFSLNPLTDNDYAPICSLVVPFYPISDLVFYVRFTLLATCFLLNLLFGPEDGGNKFL